MGLLDNNKVLVSELTGLEGTDFNLQVSNEFFDLWIWDNKGTGKVLKATFDDIYAWANSENLYLVQGKITDEPTAIAINSTNFPNLRTGKNGSYPSITRVSVIPCTFTNKTVLYGHVSDITADKHRVCVMFDNGQIYHNYPSCNDDCDFYNLTWANSGATIRVDSLFTKFDESVIWDLPDRKHPVKTNSGNDAALIATGKYYYNPALPDSCYEFHPALNTPNGYGNTVGFGSTTELNPISSGASIAKRGRFWRTDMDNPDNNALIYSGGYVADNLFTMFGTFEGNNATKPSRICVFGTQDGGRNWYCMYEFAGKDRNKHDGNYTAADGTVGIDLSQEGSAGSGIYSIKRRTLIIPDATDKEPSTLFEYANNINVSSITGTSEGITFTTASAHGMTRGDVIVVGFQDGVSASGRTFDWMVNSDADGTTGGNGILFKVTDVTADTFKVTMYIWNPDTNFLARHIHTMNRCKDGVVICSGEAYPLGGWIIYDLIKRADSFSNYNVASLDSSQNSFIRLNSTKDSCQRPTGGMLRQEDDGTYFYFFSDEEGISMNNVEMPEGRTETFKHNSAGVWRVPLDGIDSLADNGQMVCPIAETCYVFKEVGNAWVFTTNYGSVYISYDYGKSWITARVPYPHRGHNFLHISGMTYDRRFSIDNVLIQLKK